MKPDCTHILAMALLCGSANAQTKDKWFAPDKLAHFVVGTAIGGAGTFIYDDARVGFALGCGVGVLKELNDRRHPDIHTASWKDAAVTCLGAGLGAGGMRWMLTRQAGVTTVSYAVGF